MITHEDRLVLKELLGSRFMADIKDVLLQNEVYTSGAQTYSKGHISKVLSGEYENDKIEAAIWTVAEQRKAAKELLKQRIQSVKTKNPVSSNSTGGH